VVVLGAIGFGGWYVYHSQDKTETANNTTSPTLTPTPSFTVSSPTPTLFYHLDNKLVLENGNISFIIPSGWEKADLSINDLVADATADTCHEGAGIRPVSNPKTIFNEEYHTFVLICDTAVNDAQEWLSHGLMFGLAGSNDESLNSKTNGLDSYYFRQNTDSYIDINYAFVTGAKGVLVKSRVSATHYDQSGNIDASVDLTSYIPDVKAFAESIQVNP